MNGLRLTNWAETNNLRAAGQAGFKEDHRCTDNLLILRTVIEQQRATKAPLYTCFVDLRKAYERERERCYIVCLRSGVDLSRHPNGPRQLFLLFWISLGQFPRAPLESHLGRRTPASHTRSGGGD